MMIPPPSAGDPYAAAAALDRRLRSPDSAGDDASSDSTLVASGPDVVVTLGKGATSPSTYDASGKLPGALTLDDMGANAPDSLAHASESGEDDTASAPDATSASASTGDAGAQVDEDAAVPA